MPTPHNEAKKGEIAKTVIMPGDPLRSKYIAETFLDDAVLVNNVRGVQGYTGTYKGVKLTVMASGMGAPAMGIYSWELFGEYDVDNIIRVGSAGGISDDVKLKDILVAQGVSYQTSYPSTFEVPGTFAPLADYRLLSAAVETAKDKGIELKVGNVLSGDYFYYPEGKAHTDEWKKMGILGVEMECAALYTNAAYFGKRALCICTVSDHLYKSERLSSEERQLGFSQMIEIALDTAVKMNG